MHVFGGVGGWVWEGLGIMQTSLQRCTRLKAAAEAGAAGARSSSSSRACKLQRGDKDCIMQAVILARHQATTM